jgi:ribose transport system substrate-binding protein
VVIRRSAFFPPIPPAQNALFQGLKKRGEFIVAYGAEPNLPTAASFTVGTDIKGAAMRACEDLIKIMGDKGNILNVLEMVTNINTTRRAEGIKEVVAKHPNVHIIQTVSDMTSESEATTKIQGGLAARGQEVDADAMIATGYNPTVAAAAILTEWHKDPKHKRKYHARQTAFRFVRGKGELEEVA